MYTLCKQPESAVGHVSIPIVAILASLSVTAAQAQLANEQLLEPGQSGFHVAAHSDGNTLRETESVPSGETVAHWSEMVTTEIMPGQTTIAPSAFLNSIGQRWIASCPTPQPHEIHTGRTNGYVVSMMLLRCDRSPATGGPENTLFRAIQGNASFYLVQYAFRSDLDKDKLAKAAHFLSKVSACDSRNAEHPCPALRRITP